MKKTGICYWLGTLLALSSTLSLLALAGCQGSTAQNTTPTSTATTVTYPLTLTDQNGQTVTFTKAPTKIVSLAPSNTEIVYALGLGDNLIGDTTYDTYPPDAVNKPKMGGYSTVDIEAVTAAQPDLILTANIHEATVVPQLKQLGFTVFTLDPKNLQDILTAIKMVGQITDHVAQATEVTSSMQTSIDAVTAKTKTLTASQLISTLYVVSASSSGIYVAGANTFTDEMIRDSGGTNVASSLSGYQTMSVEALVAANPKVIIFGSSMGSESSALSLFQTDPRLKTISAVTNNQLYQIDADIASHAGPRIVDALALIAKMIHPEIFGPPTT